MSQKVRGFEPDSALRVLFNLAYLVVELQVIRVYNPQYMTYFEVRRAILSAELASKGTYLYIHFTRFLDPQWFLGLFAYLGIVFGTIVFVGLINRKLDIAWIAKWVGWGTFPLIYYAFPPGIRAWDYFWWAAGFSKYSGPTRPPQPVEVSPDIGRALDVSFGLGCLLPLVCLFTVGIFVLIAWRIYRGDQWKGYSIINVVLTYFQIPLMFYIGEMLTGVYDRPDMTIAGFTLTAIIAIDFYSYVPPVAEGAEWDVAAKKKKREYVVIMTLLWLALDVVIFLLLIAPLIAKANHPG